MKVRHFASAAKLREWLARRHATATELWVGFHKKATGKPSVTWPESVDEALCYGWIDGIRKSLGETSYAIRFTPRRKGSIWSAVNIRRAAVLRAEGRMAAAGLAAFEVRKENKSGIYSYEQRRDRLDAPYAATLRRNAAARRFFEAQPASYRRAAVWWVVSAKQEATRQRRLDRLIRDSESGRRIAQFTRPEPRKVAARVARGRAARIRSRR